MQKQACANVGVVAPPPVADGAAAVAAAKRVAPKPVGQKKVTAKPKPEQVVIEISPDKKEAQKDKHVVVHKKKEGGDAHSKKKPQHTLSSVLTARSKVRK